ncbi:PolC-type DNA polymerase III [Terribacillus sp. DMT04]|uniref:3'-5' exonuclease n=1 Tax=Terribacillus sp. DMT04 TaxID=2850441 RepID=UPI001C2C2D01|nr:exonuclease domain-containing protein [Terribacillus sp. DMT04]QXE00362.1 3'-5' exoribonuclease [Terribacillus sp. DMT04]
MIIDLQLFRYMLYGKLTQHIKRKALMKEPAYEQLQEALTNYKPARSLREVPFEDQTFTVFDLETTGFFPDFGHEIISIGAVQVQGNHILSDETFYEVAKPMLKTPKKIIKLTKMDPDEIENAPAFTEVMERFLAYSKDTILVAHPASFDIRFIQTMLKMYKLPPLSCYTLDSQIMARMFFKKRQCRLDSLISRFEVPQSDRHHALGDAKMTANVFVRLLDMAADRGIRDYASLQLPLSKIKKKIRTAQL